MLLPATFCVNSLAHIHGDREFDPASSAGNSTLTAIVTFGEGYHNYHHRYPYDFRSGTRWWHYDPSKWLITALSKVGLASDLRRASPGRVAAAVGDRSAPPPDIPSPSTTGGFPS